MERKDDIFAISHETNNGSIVHIAHQVSSAASPGVTLHSAQHISVMLPSSLVQTGRNQSMGVESESKGNMLHATQ